ncbi:reverse transcriptase-like protein [Fictibacillus gelatini]|uniref:reverse transcriptase-like protein n=1 Tax=Fictibacillus gelatini TaxID=225985 RepID=UPI0004217FEB|nr:reverse transcriptase-like protein [Fictibacillus gelatini]
MKITIEWNYKPAKSSHTIRFVSDSLSLKEAIRTALDIERTGRLGTIMFIDENGTYWSKKELQKLAAEKETVPMNVVCYFDGGYKKDDGKSGQGAVIYYEQNEKRYRYRVNASLEQIDSNNESEYAALWLLVNELEQLGVHHSTVTIKGDSMVVIHQMTDEWPCYEQELQRWMDKIEAKLKKLGLTPIFELIPRNENKEADFLATQALSNISIEAKKEMID